MADTQHQHLAKICECLMSLFSFSDPIVPASAMTFALFLFPFGDCRQSTKPMTPNCSLDEGRLSPISFLWFFLVFSLDLCCVLLSGVGGFALEIGGNGTDSFIPRRRCRVEGKPGSGLEATKRESKPGERREGRHGAPGRAMCFCHGKGNGSGLDNTTPKKAVWTNIAPLFIWALPYESPFQTCSSFFAA